MAVQGLWLVQIWPTALRVALHSVPLIAKIFGNDTD